MGVRMKSKKEDKNVWVTTDWLKIIIILCVAIKSHDIMDILYYKTFGL